MTLPVTNEQAKAIQKAADFGTTVVEEGGQLARYVGRVLGTLPHDTVGLVLGDPLHFVRTVIAGQYDDWLTKIFERRRVTDTQPVSPAVAIPLLRAAYDESRPELQQMWAELIAAAMDPARSSRVRISFIDTLKRFDPLDARVLKYLFQATIPGPSIANISMDLASKWKLPPEEIDISLDNLADLRCVLPNIKARLTQYGRGLINACND